MWLKKPYVEDAKITSLYGERVHPVTGIKKLHKGIDISLPIGTKLYAPLSGTVYRHDDPKGYGHYLTLSSVTEAGTKVLFLFAHLSEILIKDGETVKEFENIALSGNSGLGTGAHLHLETRIYDHDRQEFIAADPMQYFNFRGA